MQTVVQIAMMIALAAVVMGFIVVAWQWINRKRLDNPFAWIVLCVSLSLLIAWVLLLPTELGLGSGDDSVGQLIVVSILMCSILVGVVYGKVSWGLRCSAGANDISTSEVSSSQATDSDSRIDSRSTSPGLLWFTLGLLLALGLTFLAGWISYDFVDRGPVTMRTEWGGTIRAHDTIVDAATGLLIIVIGWVTGLAGLRFQLRRSLVVGFIVGATLLGILFALKGR